MKKLFATWFILTLCISAHAAKPVITPEQGDLIVEWMEINTSMVSFGCGLILVLIYGQRGSM